MAQIVIDVNDNIAVDVRDTLCTKWGYTGANTNAAKMAFLKLKIAEHIKSEYKEQKANEAGLAATAAAQSTAGSADIS